MSHQVKWGLFIFIPVIGITLVYAIWAEALSLSIIKAIISMVILEAVILSLSWLGKNSAGNAPTANNIHGCS